MSKKIYMLFTIGEPVCCTRSLTKARELFVKMGHNIDSIIEIRKQISENGSYEYYIDGGHDTDTIIKAELL